MPVMSCCCIVSVSVLCLRFAWSGLLMYWMPSPACEFHVHIVVVGGGGLLLLWLCCVMRRMVVILLRGCWKIGVWSSVLGKLLSIDEN